MAQNDLVIINQSFPSFRSDLNSALQAIYTTHSGTSLPSGASAGTIWLDTTSATTPTLKYYDGTDNISLATIDHVGNTVNWLDSTVSITGISTTATGTVLTLTDSASTSTVNLIIDNQKEIRFRETTANGTNYVALKAPASVSADLTFTLPSADGTAGQFLKTDGAGALSFATVSSGSLPFKNIFINGDMQIAQRSTSVASITSVGYYTLDRWKPEIGTMGTFTMSQSTDVPTGQGFAKSLKLDCTTADASPSAGDYIILHQLIEGQNLQYLKKGTANAVSLTASFWVKSTKTGTFIIELVDMNNNRSISKSYTVNTTNTWEKKTLTFDGDTTGEFNNDNGESLRFSFWLGAGSTYTSGTLATTWGTITNANRVVGQVNIADSTSNDFLITGVQLEAGTSATDFEFLPIDVSLGRCQRYYHQIYSNSGTSAYTAGIDLCIGTDYDAGQLFIMKDLPTTMRDVPSIVQTTGTSYLTALRSAVQDSFNGFDGTGLASYNNIAIFTSGSEGYSGVTGVSVRVRVSSTSYKLAVSAEL